VGGDGIDGSASMTYGSPMSYAAAGVDVAAGEAAVRAISERVARTFGPEVLGGLGGFASLYALPRDRWREPVLVTSTDGVGTKSQIARATGRFDTIGIDLVAMCVDDIVCQGAVPLLFLDYIAVSQLDPAQVREIVEGIASGCEKAGCALVGGEMAEHPGVMEPGDFDLAGFALGIVERDEILGAELVEDGDVLVGLVSPGLRSNGYSLAREALLKRDGRRLDGPAWPGAASSLADVLLDPSVIYAPGVLAVLGAEGGKERGIHALAHVTGGGLPSNLARVLPPWSRAVVDVGSWQIPRIFAEVRSAGAVPDGEMLSVFNLGIGMVAITASAGVGRVIATLGAMGYEALEIGRIERAIPDQQGAAVSFTGHLCWPT